MPNHVTNVLTLHGESDQIRAMLEAIQYDDLGIGSVDFNKIIPMPESLNIEAGSQTSTGLKAYQDFIEVYTLGGTIHQDDLENIPRKSEDAFLRQRSDIRPKEWKLGKAAWNNIRLYGVPTWYGWRNQHWGTKWNSYGYGEAEVNSNICAKERFGYSDDQFQYTYDPEKAKELLAEAGIETPYDLGEILVAEKYSNLATVIQNDLKAVGLDVTISVKEFNSYISDLQNGSYGITALNMTLEGRHSDTGDGIYF